MGAVSSDVIFDSLSPESQKRVRRKTRKAIEEIEALRDIRKQLGFTQSAVADAMDLKQNNISELEARSDMLLSTLRSYVESMGCELEITIKKPDQTRMKFKRLPGEENRA